MATIVPEPPKIDIDRLPGPGGRGGDRRNQGPDGELRRVKDSSPPPASTGIWVALGAIAMTFAAFTSALVVRKGGTDWRHIPLPPILYWNTLVIIASSVTLEAGRRRITSFVNEIRTQNKNKSNSNKKRDPDAIGWFYLTLFLGILFVAGQSFAWLQLRSQGLKLATNINYSFFYVLTVAHALHVAGGLGGLVRVIDKINKSALRRSTLDATSRYWHFMGILWIYLLLLLWIKL